LATETGGPLGGARRRRAHGKRGWALIAAYADRKAIVDESAARVAAAEVTAD
jgi:hypothetical protein